MAKCYTGCCDQAISISGRCGYCDCCLRVYPKNKEFLKISDNNYFQSIYPEYSFAEDKWIYFAIYKGVRTRWFPDLNVNKYIEIFGEKYPILYIPLIQINNPDY